MMTDNELETIYKSAISESHFAGLRAVWDAGYQTSSGTTLTYDETAVVASPNDAAPTVVTP